MVKLKGILKAPSAAAIRQLTTDHSLGLGVDFTDGGKPSKHGRDQLYNNSTHTSSKFFDNQHKAIPITHPALTLSDRA